MATFDIYIAPLPPEEQSLITGAIGFRYDKTIAVRGFNRLINKWMLEFLTEEGSDPTDRAKGTKFPLLFGGNVSSIQDISEICRLAVDKANARIRQYQRDYSPESLDETFADATIASISYDETVPGIDLTVRIENASGQYSLLPLPNTSTP